MNKINFPLWVGPPTKCTTRSFSRVFVKGSIRDTRHGAIHVVITVPIGRSNEIAGLVQFLKGASA